MTTIYYSPEDYGLKPIFSLDEENLDYEFHILAAWQDQSGRIYWGEDSGCSCPSPFEDYHFKGADDHNLETSIKALYEAIDSFPASDRDKAQIREFLDKATVLDQMADLQP